MHRQHLGQDLGAPPRLPAGPGRQEGRPPTVPPPGAAPGGAPGAEPGGEPARPRRLGARARFRRFAGASAAGGRDPFLDNTRFLLVLLVVLGHNWSPVVDGMRGVQTVYLLVYAFHLPALVLLCGYFSRGFTGRPEQVRKLLAGVLVPYLVFEAAYAGVHTLFWDRPFAFTPAAPGYLCWFLAALFVWRLTAPLWRAVRWPVAVAALVSVGAGLTDLDGQPALARLVMLLPWFVLGLRLRQEHLRPLRNRAARRWALPVMSLAAVAAYWAAPRVDRDWLLMEHGSAQLGVSPAVYVVARLGLFAVSAVLAAAFLALVPSGRAGFTALGACTLYPFLLHGLLVRAAEGLGAYGAVHAGGLMAVAATTLLAGAVAVLLGAAPVRRVLRPLVEPRFPRWLTPRER
ncbi:acyltransferase family protein [Streptomyces boncukensis]|uniref:Acyltransferase 3 domain-containing protein n=1 Tax=Streptomyces boncukensis TaxID=2711219 RepID=A0A6G4X4Y9_9ACTN|nr:hypothetical protein [Streptomyces boncukensis]NGO72323.1 hypothetical protein [Streptomyces boncukensis]